MFDIRAIKIGSEATLNSWASQLSDWIGETGKTYISAINTDGSGITVKVLDAKASYVAGNPRMLMYTLKLLEAGSVV